MNPFQQTNHAAHPGRGSRSQQLTEVKTSDAYRNDREVETLQPGHLDAIENDFNLAM
jgi:hypothetical protein